MHNVKTNQYGSYWCVYDVENQYGMESRDDKEFNMEWRINEATFDSDIYKALLDAERVVGAGEVKGAPTSEANRPCGKKKHTGSVLPLLSW